MTTEEATNKTPFQPLLSPEANVTTETVSTNLDAEEPKAKRFKSHGRPNYSAIDANVDKRQSTPTDSTRSSQSSQCSDDLHNKKNDGKSKNENDRNRGKRGNSNANKNNKRGSIHRQHRIIARHGKGHDLNPSGTTKCVGRLLQKLRPYMGYVQKFYTVLLFNSIIITILLIASRSMNQGLFGISFFESDSPPLLIAANVTMMISYSIQSYFILRTCLSCGCVLFSLWAITSKPLLFDTCMFNAVMLLLNVRHACILLYNRRYIDFAPEYEQIYQKVFSPYLSRPAFEQLMKISFIRHVAANDVFKQKGDLVTSLCIIVSGRIQVLRNGPTMISVDTPHKYLQNLPNLKNLKHGNVSNNLNIVNNNGDDATMSVSRTRTHSGDSQMGGITGIMGMDSDYNDGERYSDSMDTMIRNLLLNPDFINVTHENEFVEAPQWVAAGLDPESMRFDVGFRALENCVFIKWPRENLVNLIESNYEIYVAMQAVLGVHTAKLLLRSRQYTKEMEKLSKNFKKKESDEMKENVKKEIEKSKDTSNNSDKSNKSNKNNKSSQPFNLLSSKSVNSHHHHRSHSTHGTHGTHGHLHSKSLHSLKGATTKRLPLGTDLNVPTNEDNNESLQLIATENEKDSNEIHISMQQQPPK